MAAAGVIKESKSGWASPIVLVRKKDGTLRFCIDYRKLNARTICDAYPLPRIEEALDIMSGSTLFSSLDLRSGYWQIPVKEEDRSKTAFTAGPMGHWEFDRMAFGLVNAAATFQRAMENTLHDLLYRECIVYIDDVIVFSKDFESHIARLDAVLKRLISNGLKVKPSKCEFFKDEIMYLGHKISAAGISADPRKIDSVKSWPEPTNIKELRSFIGFASFFRKFIKDFALHATPLTSLLKGQPVKRKGKRPTHQIPAWEWQDEHHQAFQKLKECLISTPVLGYADFSLPFILEVDASRCCIITSAG
jgi:hypothetical protein